MKARAIGLIVAAAVFLPAAPVAAASPAPAPEPAPSLSAPVAPAESEGEPGSPPLAELYVDDTAPVTDPVTAPNGQPVSVLTLGAGLASVGLGLAFLGLRLRRQ